MKLIKNELVLDSRNIPRHVACIMDGNGRWAKKRGLPRTIGHKVGVDRVIEIIDESSNLGIKVLTVFAFSTENWKRDSKEIDEIFRLLENMLDRQKAEFVKKNIKVVMIGTLEKLNPNYKSLKKNLENIIMETKNNTGLIFNIAFNYGSHDEIIRAVKMIGNDIYNKRISVNDIDEGLFESYLMTSDLEKVDLMIRTSGECRLSNFLLWQLAYSELCFIDTYWPDFNKEKLRECIYNYQRRDRRYGNVK